MGDVSEIDKLTDDCLVKVFESLTAIADKVSIERVCKRWQNVSQRSWNNFKSLDFSAKTWGIQKNNFKNSLIRSIDLDKIINLCGRFLTSVSTDVKTFARICHSLPHIRQLVLRDDCLDYQDPNDCEIQCTCEAWIVVHSWLVSHGQNVRIFKMEICHTHYAEKDFASFLRTMKKLQTLYLCAYPVDLSWSGSFLLELPFETIEEICLNYINEFGFDEGSLSTMIKKSKKLRTLHIEDLDESETVEVLEVLPWRANTLKNMKLRMWSPSISESLVLSTVSALVHLEKLDVRWCEWVNDAFLKAVGEKCKELTYLNLSYCDKVTDSGISIICNLEKLTYLRIQGANKIKNPPLEKLINLLVLDTAWISHIEEKCICSFLQKACQIRALDVWGCKLITNKVLNLAVEIAKNRNDNNALDLAICFTGIDRHVLVDKPPLLNFMYLSNKEYGVQYGIEDPFLRINDPEVYTK